MKRIVKAYKELLGIIFSKIPVVVILTFIISVAKGSLIPFGVYVNEHIFNDGLRVASGELQFSRYSVFLLLFIIMAILPSIFDMFVYGYVGPRSVLILNTSYRARMLQKIKKMKYEHFENEESAKIIDIAYNHTERAARHMWPNFIDWTLSSVVASVGIIFYLLSIRWWLVLTVLTPFIIETYFVAKSKYDIYSELDAYWKKERQYGILGGYLKSRDYMKELKLFGNADYLIDTYRDRLNKRNTEFEKYYFKHLRHRIFNNNLTKFASFANVIILLVLFIQAQISVGLFIAMSALMLGGVYNSFNGCMVFFRYSGMHIKGFEYFDKFFGLSEETGKNETELPEFFDIEFKDVWFKYPGTETDI